MDMEMLLRVGESACLGGDSGPLPCGLTSVLVMGLTFLQVKRECGTHDIQYYPLLTAVTQLKTNVAVQNHLDDSLRYFALLHLFLADSGFNVTEPISHKFSSVINDRAMKSFSRQLVISGVVNCDVMEPVHRGHLLDKAAMKDLTYIAMFVTRMYEFTVSHNGFRVWVEKEKKVLLGKLFFYPVTGGRFSSITAGAWTLMQTVGDTNLFTLVQTYLSERSAVLYSNDPSAATKIPNRWHTMYTHLKAPATATHISVYARVFQVFTYPLTLLTWSIPEGTSLERFWKGVVGAAAAGMDKEHAWKREVKEDLSD